MMSKTNFKIEKYLNALEQAKMYQLQGKITQAIGLTMEAAGPKVSLGELCYVKTNRGDKEYVPCEVVGFKNNRTLLMPLGNLEQAIPSAFGLLGLAKTG
jgi:flagellum-specific ATP synthase